MSDSRLFARFARPLFEKKIDKAVAGALPLSSSPDSTQSPTPRHGADSPSPTSEDVAMGWMQFVSDLTGHVISWPVAAVTIAVLLRREIVKLLGRLRRLSGSWGTAEFDEELEKSGRQLTAVSMEAGTVNADAAPAEPEGASTGAWAQISEASTIDPEGVILRAWQKLERDLAAMQPQHDLATGGQWLLPRNAPGPIFDAFKSLRRIRNEVVHGQVEPTRSQALDFRLQVEWLRDAVDRWHRANP